MSDSAPTVSVCIPTYNRGSMLRDSIHSVLTQTFSDFELIISDNASEDDTESIVRSFSDERIRYSRNSSNIGVRHNWNRCLALARGKYIAIFPDDDIMLPENLARKVAVLAGHPHVGLVHSHYQVMDPCGRILTLNATKIPNGHRTLDGPQPGREVLVTLLGRNIIHESTVLFRRACFEACGGFTDRLSLAFDWEYWMRIAERYDIACIPTPLVKWRDHSASVTRQQSRRSDDTARSALRIDLDGLRWILKKYLPSVSHHRLEARMLVWRQMGERVAGFAEVMLGDGGPSADVRTFVVDMVRNYPEILVEKTVLKVILKSILSRRSILTLKRMCRL